VGENDCDITAFAERDIDVWLAEELRFNAPFCRWFLEKAGVDVPVEVPAWRVRVSVVDEIGRETDVEALFRLSDDTNLALLIEDKIKAIFQPEQLEDYLDRVRRGIAAKKWSRGNVVVCAPSYRSLALPSQVAAIRFADAIGELERVAQDGRSRYRADFLRRADNPSAGMAAAPDAAAIAFWLAIDKMVQREFGEKFVVERNSFPRQTWINPRWPDMPSYLRLDLKGSYGEVDLAFRNFPFYSFSQAVRPLCGPGMQLVEHGKSSAIRIGGLQKFNVHDDLSFIDSCARPAYASALKLIEFWRTHRVLFDDMAKSVEGTKSARREII
jgi:hypothetical protein